MNNSALIEPAYIFRCHAKKLNIVRQKMAGGGKKQRKSPAEAQTHPRKHQQRPAISNQPADKISLI